MFKEPQSLPRRIALKKREEEDKTCFETIQMVIVLKKTSFLK